MTYNWDENDWTKRLAAGIQKLLPSKKVMYTATMGPTWNVDLLQNCLAVGKCALAEHFLFRGSPDILIGKNQAATLVTAGMEENDEGLVENTYQRNPMKGKDAHSFPEKVGEVFAGLYILLVSAILKNMDTQQDVRGRFQVQGLLLDKVCGAVQCILSVQVQEGAAPLKFQVTNTVDGLLEPRYLYSRLHKF